MMRRCVDCVGGIGVKVGDGGDEGEGGGEEGVVLVDERDSVGEEGRSPAPATTEYRSKTARSSSCVRLD